MHGRAGVVAEEAAQRDWGSTREIAIGEVPGSKDLVDRGVEIERAFGGDEEDGEGVDGFADRAGLEERGFSGGGAGLDVGDSVGGGVDEGVVVEDGDSHRGNAVRGHAIGERGVSRLVLDFDGGEQMVLEGGADGGVIVGSRWCDSLLPRRAGGEEGKAERERPHAHRIGLDPLARRELLPVPLRCSGEPPLLPIHGEYQLFF